MSLTAEQTNIAETIAARVDRLVQAGKSQATILGEMADCMAGFKQLLDAGVVQEAAHRYPGFRQFAKILDRTARGIQSGAIPVPGRRAPARRSSATTEARRLAAEIDLRMRQLAEQEVPPSAVIERMGTYVIHLQKIWTSTSDDELAALCREYPGFHDYAVLMEDAAEAERRKPTRSYDGLPELPDGLKEQLLSLLSSAAKLERDYQSVLDAAGAPAPAAWLAPHSERYAAWAADLARFIATMQSSTIPQRSQDFVLHALHGIARRVFELKTRAEQT
jgi:hypothetical protein